MKRDRNDSARASTLQITLALPLTLISAILLASSFKAAQDKGVAPEQSAPAVPNVACGAGTFRVEATNSGNDANYATLQATFLAINAGTHTGVINIGVCADSLAEPAGGATLNASGSGSASYSSILMTPSGARTISGAISGGSALMSLNGADNVTINGLNTGGNSLTLSNTTATSILNTSTIFFANGAQNNVITNCSILGSSFGGVGVATGNIVFRTSAAGGNSSNTISNNNIGPAGANLPTQGISSLGSASPNDNTLNLIENNNIFDYFSATIGVSGITLLSGNNNWTISNNRIYQTAARTFTAAGLTYAGITVTSSGNSYIVTGNTIGFGAANGTGTTTISGSTNVFVGLNLTSTSTSTATSVQGNTISGINQTTASLGTGSTAAFRGIHLAQGRYDVGTTTGNTIGSLTGASTITFNQSSIGAIYGIFDFSSSSNQISNNNIGAITINGTGMGTGGFRGIRLNTSTAATATINNNTIGGSGAGAITDNLVGPYSMIGIETVTAPPTVSATGNTIQNLSGNSTADTAVVSSGLFLRGTVGANTVSQNVVHSLSNNSNAASNSIYGINCTFGNTANVVERNVVHSLSFPAAGTTSQLAGLVHAAGTATYRNNMVRLGVDAAGASILGGFQIYGIAESAGTANLYFNSVYIGGAGVASASSTFAFGSSVFTGTRNYLDNIFYNARSNSSGPGNNYAIGLSGLTGVTSNRNNLFVSGTGGFVGVTPGPTDHLTLADWQAATSQDANSISADPQFIDPNGTARPGGNGLGAPDAIAALVNLHILGTSPCVGAGAPAGGLTNDIDNQLRNPLTPDIGADEVSPWTGGNVSITKTADATGVGFGNQIGFTVRLNNSYPGTATGLSVTDALPAATGVSWSIDGANTDPGWSVSGSPPAQSLIYSPTTLPGSTMTEAHVVSSTTSATCGATLNNTASFTTSDAGSGKASASILVVGTASKIFAELFDSVTQPALPAGWVATNDVGPAPLWVTSNVGSPAPAADSLPNAAFIDDPAALSDKRLDSPPIGIVSPGAQVTFRQNRDLENNTGAPTTAFDGGVLEISIASGAFTDVITAGGSFATGGYNTTVATQFFSPIAGRAAWSGSTTGAFITSTVNLPPSAAGQSIVLRWRMASDSSVSKTGWRVDGISITDFPCAAQPTPTPVPTATPTPTPTPTPTATPTPTPPCPSQTKTFAEFFDSETVPALPAGWIAVNAVDTDGLLWVTSDSGVPAPAADSAPNAAFINDPAGVNDKRLDSPSIVVFSAFAQLSFRNNYELEPISGGGSFFDGGVVEVSSPNINAGAFTDITDAAVGGSFVAGGYNGTISTEFGSPIAGRMAWSQSSGGFITTTATLGPNVAGQTIKLRWRMGSDTTVTGNGWRIDSVSILDCAPTPTPTPATVSISGNVFNCSSPAPTATPTPPGPTATPAATPPVPDVTMTLTGTSAGSTTTDGAGNFSFTGLASGGTYTITPSKGPLAAGTGTINTQDVLAVQRHALGITLLPDGCRLTAADAVVNGTVNTQDVVAIQRFSLGFTTAIGSVGQYKFTPENYSYPGLVSSQTGQNFAMFVIGDSAAAFVNRGGTSAEAAAGDQPVP